MFSPPVLPPTLFAERPPVGEVPDAQAFIITTPSEAFIDAELTAVQEFVADGGGIVLIGAAAPPTARANLNAVADALCLDLQLNTGRVVDSADNVGDAPAIPTTSNLDRWFRLFASYTGDTKYKRARGGPGRPGCHVGRPGQKNGHERGHEHGHGRW